MNLGRIILGSLFVIISVQTNAQDLIITNDGDSLNCKITNIYQEKVYFTYSNNDTIVDNYLTAKQVKDYQFDYYKEKAKHKNKNSEIESFQHFRAAISGGLSYRTAKIPDNLSSMIEEYVKDLKSGYNYQIDLSYYFSEQIGIGLKYNAFRSKNKKTNILVTTPDAVLLGDMSDNITISFIGPSFTFRKAKVNEYGKNYFIMDYGMGYLRYKNDALLINELYYRGGTFGMCFDIGYDIAINENLAWGIKASYVIGTMTQFELSDGKKTELVKLDKENYEHLSHIDISIGLRFNK